MAASPWRLGTICVVAAAAYAIMVSWAAVSYGRNELLDAAFLLPSAVVYCLAGLLVRSRPVASTVLLVAVIVLSGASVLGYVLGNSMSSVAVWVVQWAAGLTTLIAATVVRQVGSVPGSDGGREAPGRQPSGVLGFTLVGLVVGAVLGFGLCWLILTIDVGGGGDIGCSVAVSVVGMKVFQGGMVFGELVPVTIYALICVATGIAGAFIASRLAKSRAAT